MRIVQKPSVNTPLIATNNVRSEKPSTTSGIVNGSTSNVFTHRFPVNRYFTRASDIAVPSTVEISVASAAMRRLSLKPLARSGSSKGWSHASRLNLPHA